MRLLTEILETNLHFDVQRGPVGLVEAVTVDQQNIHKLHLKTVCIVLYQPDTFHINTHMTLFKLKLTVQTLIIC